MRLSSDSRRADPAALAGDIFTQFGGFALGFLDLVLDHIADGDDSDQVVAFGHRRQGARSFDAGQGRNAADMRVGVRRLDLEALHPAGRRLGLWSDCVYR